MRSPSYFAEDIFREELLEVHRSFDLADAPTRRNDLLRAARAVPYELLADQTLGLDGGDGVLLKLHVTVEAKHHARLIVRQSDRFHAPDLDARDLHAGARLEAAHRGEVHRDDIAGAAEERDASEFNRKIPQCQDAEDQEQPDRDVDSPLHGASSG